MGCTSDWTPRAGAKPLHCRSILCQIRSLCCFFGRDNSRRRPCFAWSVNVACILVYETSTFLVQRRHHFQSWLRFVHLFFRNHFVSLLYGAIQYPAVSLVSGLLLHLLRAEALVAGCFYHDFLSRWLRNPLVTFRAASCDLPSTACTFRQTWQPCD